LGLNPVRAARPLALEWCADGGCEAVARLAPGRREAIRTYPGHVFVARDAAGREVARVAVGRDLDQVFDLGGGDGGDL